MAFSFGCAHPGKVYNVVGVLKGTNPKKAVILSAHFDGVSSFGKVQMTAAYDNGSGTAALMEIAGRLAERAKREPFAMDIIVCCFNGEEILHQGSSAFADKISFAYDEMYNINIDCIGGKDCGSLAMKPVNDASAVLSAEMFKYLDKNDIPYNREAEYGGSENDGNAFINRSAVTEAAEEDDTDWDRVREEADRLTEGMDLGYNEIFVFEVDGKKYRKSGYRPLLSEEEAKKYYPDFELPQFDDNAVLAGYTLEKVDIFSTNTSSLSNYYGNETGKVTLDLKREDIRSVSIVYCKEDYVIEITISSFENKIQDPDAARDVHR